MLKLINEYLELIITIITSLGVIIGLLGQLFKNKKLLKLSETITLYKTIVEDYVVKAEKMQGLSGKEKLHYVIAQVKIELGKLNIEIDEQLIIQLVEEIIELSKNVNFKS